MKETKGEKETDWGVVSEKQRQRKKDYKALAHRNVEADKSQDL
jgi:hypothetical protein